MVLFEETQPVVFSSTRDEAGFVEEHLNVSTTDKISDESPWFLEKYLERLDVYAQ